MQSAFVGQCRRVGGGVPSAVCVRAIPRSFWSRILRAPLLGARYLDRDIPNVESGLTLLLSRLLEVDEQPSLYIQDSDVIS